MCDIWPKWCREWLPDDVNEDLKHQPLAVLPTPGLKIFSWWRGWQLHTCPVDLQHVCWFLIAFLTSLTIIIMMDFPIIPLSTFTISMGRQPGSLSSRMIWQAKALRCWQSSKAISPASCQSTDALTKLSLLRRLFHSFLHHCQIALQLSRCEKHAYCIVIR